MSAKQCAVRGMVHPGAMCGKVLVGGRGCGYAGECEHQRKGTSVEAMASRVERRVFQIPKRSEDPVAYAKFWFGDDLWDVLIERASVVRLSLHSGLVPGLEQREALQRLKRLEQRNLLNRVGRSGGRIQFAPSGDIAGHLMQAGEQRAQAQKGQA